MSDSFKGTPEEFTNILSDALKLKLQTASGSDLYELIETFSKVVTFMSAEVAYSAISGTDIPADEVIELIRNRTNHGFNFIKSPDGADIFQHEAETAMPIH